MSASVLANSYIVTGPTGSIVTSASNTTNASNVLSTTDLAFNVTYPVGFIVTTTTPVSEKTIAITSVNGVGNSLTNKVVTLATALANIGVNTNSYVNPNTGIPSIALFGKCNTQTISVPSVPFATSYVWTPANGAVILSGQGTNTVEVDYSAVATVVGTKNFLKVKAYNGCTYSTEKSISLTWDGVTLCGGKMEALVSNSTSVSIYPNPAIDNFTVELISPEASKMTMTIFNLNGSVISTKDLQLTEGNNVINENISSLSSGIYFVNFYNSANNETIVKKLVKN